MLLIEAGKTLTLTESTLGSTSSLPRTLVLTVKPKELRSLGPALFGKSLPDLAFGQEFHVYPLSPGFLKTWRR